MLFQRAWRKDRNRLQGDAEQSFLCADPLWGRDQVHIYPRRCDQTGNRQMAIRSLFCILSSNCFPLVCSTKSINNESFHTSERLQHVQFLVVEIKPLLPISFCRG